MPLTESTLTSSLSGATLLMRDLVHERLGIFYDASRVSMMVEKLSEPAKARGCVSLMDYYYLLKYDDKGTEEWFRVMDALSVQETYFWRELAQIELLKNVLVPQWFKKNTGTLRIWSAACASGEEPYTIAMALNEAGFGNHPIQIIASDASEAALARARAGVFRPRSFRALPENLRDKYFTPSGAAWQLSPEILQKVEFRRANLMSLPEIAGMTSANVIFCRNVFIYFSPDAIRHVINDFAKGMPPGGFLFVGSSESLLKITKDFELEDINDAFVYVLKDARAKAAAP